MFKDIPIPKPVVVKKLRKSKLELHKMGGDSRKAKMASNEAKRSQRINKAFDEILNRPFTSRSS